jgi:putative ABC transport system permease protein
VSTSLAPAARIGLDALRANPLRTLLSTLGIVMGVAALVGVLALGDGMERYARAQIGATTDLHAVSVSPQLVRVVDGTPVAVADPVTFTGADAAALQVRLTAAPGTGAVVGRTLSVTAFARALATAAPRAVEVTGADAPLLRAQGVRLAAGRPFTPAEAAAGAPVALASRQLLADLATAGHRMGVGDTIRLGPPEAGAAGGSAFGAGDAAGDTAGNSAGVTVRVVGVLAELPGASAESRTAVVPPDVARRAAARTTFGLRAPAPALLVVADRVEDAPAVRAAVEAWAAARWPDWKARVRVGSRADRVQQARAGLLAFKLVMGAITGISLLVGGVGVMNVLLASVAERTREIGVRRAVGATRRDVLVQFLAESVAIAGAGSVAGVVIGVAGAFAVTAGVRARTEAEVYAGLSAGSVLSAVAITVLVGLVFGIYPARRAAGLSPIDAIRHET